MTDAIRVAGRWPALSAKQRRLVNWVPPASCNFAVTGALSATFGTGKTTAAAARAIAFIFRNANWNPGYGATNPLFVCVGPTSMTVKQNLVPIFEQLLPSELILERRSSPHDVWLLANGCKLLFLSGAGLVDSFSCSGMMVDEVHDHRAFLHDVKWRPLVGRIRDRKAGAWRELIVSGIAQPDERLKERFDRPDDPNVHIELLGLHDNPAADEAYRNLILDAYPSGYESVALDGGWAPTETGSAFTDVLSFGPGGNITRDHYAEDAKVICTLDPGKQSALLFVKEIEVDEFSHGEPTGNKVPGLCVIDELILDAVDSRQAVQLALETPYTIAKLCVDTAMIHDTRRMLRDVWTGPIDTLPKGSLQWRRSTKLNRLRWALCDTHGTRRLLIHERLMSNGDKRGLVNVLRRSKTNTAGTDVVKDDLEHAREALAQLIVSHWKPERPKAQGFSWSTLS